MSDPPWTDWYAHCQEYVERHLVAPGNVMSFILLYWFSQVHRGHLKSGEYHHQSLLMLQWENCDYKLNGAPWWQRSSPWKMKWLLRGLKSLKSLEIWRTPLMWWGISFYMFIFLEQRKMAPQRPLQNFKTTAPALCFMYEFETWQAYWRYQDVQKSLLEQYPKSNRKSAILKLMCKFGDIFPSFQASYFDELLQGISLDLRDLLCVESKDLCDVKLRSFLRSGKRGGHGGTWSFNHSPKSSNLLSLKNTMSNLSQRSQAWWDSSSEMFVMPFVSNG